MRDWGAFAFHLYGPHHREVNSMDEAQRVPAEPQISLDAEEEVLASRSLKREIGDVQECPGGIHQGSLKRPDCDP